MKKTARFLFIAGITFTAIFSFTNCGVADDSVDRRILEARVLQAKGKFAAAAKELATLAAIKELTAGQQAAIALEAGKTFTLWGMQTKESQTREKRLASALQSFSKFLTAHPKHQLSGSAHSFRGVVLRMQSRDLLSQAENNNADRKKLRGLARKKIVEARLAYGAAEASANGQLKSFPPFIPNTDRLRLAARRKAESQSMQAQLSVAQTRYDEALIWERGSAERKKQLTAAEKAFATIHGKYRTMVVGLVAHVWRAHCLSELGDVRSAIGIYQELLQHPGKSPGLINIQRQATYGYLACLNHPNRKEFTLAIKTAKNWLAANEKYHGTQFGLGIRYQLAIAQEQQAAKTGDDAKRRNELRTSARENVTILSKFGGKYKSLAAAMLERLKKSP